MYNVPSARRKKRKFNPLNLVPILDVIFILIFFLLASSQLMRIFEIGSDLPIFRLSTEEQEKPDEFELKIEVTETSITLSNYKKKKIIKRIDVDWENPDFYAEFNDVIKGIKADHPDEERVLVSSDNKVNYQHLVNLLDQIRHTRHEAGKPGRTELFRQIMFEE
ncbi:MAG: biopolymer transporter ExbD [Halobacteriovoraceae bacterium]|nr:biopolymer transporter ExbD [Halobacteriovoraceae bacterium]MCB9095775.1 biopolymer transporter ExbD [Halobacteriovoraceae bacterium]